MRGAASASARSSDREAILLTRTRVRPVRAFHKERLDAELGDGGAAADLHHLGRRAEGGQRLLDQVGALLDEILIDGGRVAGIQNILGLRQAPMNDGCAAGRGDHGGNGDDWHPGGGCAGIRRQGSIAVGLHAGGNLRRRSLVLGKAEFCPLRRAGRASGRDPGRRYPASSSGRSSTRRAWR